MEDRYEAGAGGQQGISLVGGSICMELLAAINLVTVVCISARRHISACRHNYVHLCNAR